MAYEQAPQPIQFEDLSAAQRVEAVLAWTREPIPESLVLRFAGVDLDQLENSEKETVIGVFSEPSVEHSEHEKFGTQYAMLPEQQETALQRLGIGRITVTKRVVGMTVQELRSANAFNKDDK